MQDVRSIVIQAPVQTVYDYVCDFPRHTEWNHQPAAITKTSDGPIGVGSKFRTLDRDFDFFGDEAFWGVSKEGCL